MSVLKKDRIGKNGKENVILPYIRVRKKEGKVHQTPYPANPDEVNPVEEAAESGQATKPDQVSPDNEAIAPPL